MTSAAICDTAERFARRLVTQALWPAATAAALIIAAPLVAGNAFGGLMVLWPVVAAAALVSLFLSALLLFDAVLFRLMASHGSEPAAGMAVDDVLARMRLKPRPAATRSFAARRTGTLRILFAQRAMLGLAVALTALAIA